MTTREGPVIACKRCGRQRPHRARMLCACCFWYVGKHGTRDDYPRTTWPREELLAEWEWLRQQGYTRAQAAERLGVTRDCLDAAIARERAAQRQGAA